MTDPTQRTVSRAPAPDALRVALVHNVKRLVPAAGSLHDDEAEFDSPATIQAIHDALAAHGHDVVDLEATTRLPQALAEARVDVVFNVAEGRRGRSREAQVPALCDLLGVEYTGSDAAACVLTLDKALAKLVVERAGVRTPGYLVMRTGDEPVPAGLRYPLFVKPVAEGSSKGVLASSVVDDEPALRQRARACAARYPDGALVEEYLPGREFTVGILGDRALAPMEVVFAAKGDAPAVYGFDQKLEPNDDVRYEAPAKVDDALRERLQRAALAAFRALGCRDVARVDLRLDRDGEVAFVECNPLPGLTPGWSDLCLIAQGEGMSYEALLGAILAPAAERARAGMQTTGRFPRAEPA